VNDDRHHPFWDPRNPLCAILWCAAAAIIGWSVTVLASRFGLPIPVVVGVVCGLTVIVWGQMVTGPIRDRDRSQP
jgi:hypothetical protein